MRGTAEDHQDEPSYALTNSVSHHLFIFSFSVFSHAGFFFMCLPASHSRFLFFFWHREVEINHFAVNLDPACESLDFCFWVLVLSSLKVGNAVNVEPSANAEKLCKFSPVWRSSTILSHMETVGNSWEAEELHLTLVAGPGGHHAFEPADKLHQLKID